MNKKIEDFNDLLLAADQGHAEAQNNLGEMYHDGEGVDRDLAEAVKWYQKAAENGFVEAQFDLACMYEEGNGTEENQKEAIKWFTLAADQGHILAQHRIKRNFESFIFFPI